MDHDANEHHTRVMYDLLVKQGEDMSTDEDKSTVGVNPDQQPDPEDREEGSIDAPWGEDNTRSKGETATEVFSDAVAQGFIQSRQNLLDELFDTKQPASKAEQELVGTFLEHGQAGGFESRAPLLETKAASDLTVRERLNRLR